MGAQATVLGDERASQLDRRRVDQAVGRITWEACGQLDGGRRDRRCQCDRSDRSASPSSQPRNGVVTTMRS